MSTGLVVVQILNGLQFGVLLFLIAAGLTLVFGVMDFINLAHGVQYMSSSKKGTWSGPVRLRRLPPTPASVSAIFRCEPRDWGNVRHANPPRDSG